MKTLSILVLAIALFCLGCKEFIEPSIEKKKVELLAPADGTEGVQYSQTFWWEHVEDALKYRLQVVTPNFDRTARLLIDTHSIRLMVLRTK